MVCRALNSTSYFALACVHLSWLFFLSFFHISCRLFFFVPFLSFVSLLLFCFFLIKILSWSSTYTNTFIQPHIGTGVNDSIVNQLLAKIDGVESLNNILLIGMTNRPDMIDDALTRPGRLELKMEIGMQADRERKSERYRKTEAREWVCVCVWEKTWRVILWDRKLHESGTKCHSFYCMIMS